MVVLTHVGFQSGTTTTSAFGPLLARLDVGVAVFFVISGFLLFRPHAVAHLARTRRPRTRSYFLHRALRILPVAWLATGLAAVLAPTKGAPLSAYLEHATLIHIYVSEQFLVGLTQMWSLATEVAFYVALPVIALVLCRGRRDAAWVWRVMGICAVAVLASPIWMAVNHDQPQARLWLPGFLGWFALGMLLAAWQVGRELGLLRPSAAEAIAARPGTAWALAAAVLVIATSPVAGPYGLEEPTAAEAAFKSLAYGLVGFFIVVPAIVPSRSTTVGILLGGPVAKYLGSISYGVFAYHVIVLALIDEHTGLGVFTGHFWERLGLTLVLTIPLASASFYWLERPVMRWGRRRVSRGSKVVSAS
ncbi:peptidoglycan/LPS O-acetylase OafA/YrhL [Knoellia remsis]|uniref:Peptidoglycan/LPS O-acetylase OafA/YrhL n=2 Tax=Knoellia remsis TaxID=407159 RepID=A0A2T0UUJ1_9MICO|nr:peptidoglycan/LPS O-acetylase OafA/YrhL [Knoellia remsis]